ncbi:thermonuclease family protein [Limnoraphis robusta]|uniref:Thermonuclease family protein n=1 Tax=Limnoraphis robusta CCNP1315 TaxID=3110306 RepID=A0ABU5U783_9CYAN|nr:thermonuclease family protein [Limnoraphis robusta]MEA5522910.1 thermonuclease family protein [Limnoraphis robusta CCNP1315]MEA5546828.1 thermonuclease family protein [Limnoraphis robusta CCNP1324]
MKKLLNALPFAIVGFLLFINWSESQNTATVEVPNSRRTVDPAANLPEFSVVPGSVYDGDTIRVTDGQNELKIRFACVDAPEKQQPGGIEARDGLRRILESDRNIVKLNIITTDRYGRNVAEVWTREGLVQSQLAGQGLVYPYERYKSDCPSWDAVERAGEYAIANSLGVWGDRNAVKPWDYRKK